MVSFAPKPAFAAALAALYAFAPPALAAEANYTCGGGMKLAAKFSPPGSAKGKVALTFDGGRRLALPQVLSADGGRYANASVEFWIKGRGATLTMNGVRKTCTTR